LAGANSSGKSSIMQPLLLLKQTLEEKSAAHPVYLSGDNVYLTQYEQIDFSCFDFADEFLRRFVLLALSVGKSCLRICVRVV